MKDIDRRDRKFDLSNSIDLVIEPNLKNIPNSRFVLSIGLKDNIHSLESNNSNNCHYQDRMKEHM